MRSVAGDCVVRFLVQFIVVIDRQWYLQMRLFVVIIFINYLLF